MTEASFSIRNGTDWQVQLKSTDQRLSYLFDQQLYMDITVNADNGREKTSIPAHKIVLIMNSPVFEAMIGRWAPVADTSDPSEKSNQSSPRMEILDLPDDDPASISLLIKAFYNRSSTSRMPNTFKDVLKLLVTAKKYLCSDLVNECSSYLNQILSIENAVQIYNAAQVSQENAIMNKAKDLIYHNLTGIIDNGQFYHFTQEDIIEITKSNEIEIQEIKLFNGIYSWAQKQCTSDPQDSSSTTGNEDIVGILNPILPFIRFPLMSLEDFTNHVSTKNIMDSTLLIQLFQLLSLAQAKSQTVTHAGNLGLLEEIAKKIPFKLTPRTTIPFSCQLRFAHSSVGLRRFLSSSHSVSSHPYSISTSGTRDWQHCAFQVDRNIKLVGVSFFRSIRLNTDCEVKVQVEDYTMSTTYAKVTTRISLVPEEHDQSFYVPFTPPVAILKNKFFTIRYLINGEFEHGLGRFWNKLDNIRLTCGPYITLNFSFTEPIVHSVGNQLSELRFHL